MFSCLRSIPSVPNKTDFCNKSFIGSFFNQLQKSELKFQSQLEQPLLLHSTASEFQAQDLGI